MFKIIGFLIVLIAIRLLMADVFFALEHALVSLFDLAGKIFTFAPNAVTTQMSAVGSMNYIPKVAPLPSAFVGQ